MKTGYKFELLTNETIKLLGDGPIIDSHKNDVKSTLCFITL